MSELFLKLLNISIAAGWLVLAVVLLRFVLKTSPKWVRCLLWGLVALRLLLPFTIESRLSLLPSRETVQTESVSIETPDDPTLAPGGQGTPLVYDRIVLNSGFSAVDEALNPVMAETTETMAKTGTNPTAVLKTAATVLWLVGAAAMLLYAAVSFLRMKYTVRASIELKKGVWVCDDIHDPFILGALFPRIYLPSGLDARSQAYVLAHEQAHLRRMDHLWKPLGFVLLSIHWFNPLIWIAYVLLSRDIELACDEKVIRLLDAEGKASYSDTLLAFSRPHKAITVCPVAFGEVGIKTRVKSVLHYKKPTTRAILAALIAGVAVAVCFLTTPGTAKAAEAPIADAVTATQNPKLELPKKLSVTDDREDAEPEGADEKPVLLNAMMCLNEPCKAQD